jgi:hypothetical protein
MQFTVELPDELASRIFADGREPSRAASEDIAVEAFRSHKLTAHQLSTLLGLDRHALDGFLKQREAWLEFTPEEIQSEIETGERLWKKRANGKLL